jgi:CubicO group peptidase (beta-lactamase class C family)
MPVSGPGYCAMCMLSSSATRVKLCWNAITPATIKAGVRHSAWSPFGPDTLHDLRSVTKSIVGLLYGIALDRGLVPPPEAPLLAQFPEYPELATDPQRARLTILHALTMTLGMEWDEQRPYTDPANSEIAMERAPDRYRYILERPFVAAPGERWIYSGGAVALLGHLIAKGAHTTLPEFARQALFAPLGITTFEWAEGADGVASAASGLRLRPMDLLRIGKLDLDQRVRDGCR